MTRKSSGAGYGILTLADGKVVSHEHKEVPKA